MLAVPQLTLVLKWTKDSLSAVKVLFRGIVKSLQSDLKRSDRRVKHNFNTLASILL